jgi:hypothetical protein
MGSGWIQNVFFMHRTSWHYLLFLLACLQLAGGAWGNAVNFFTANGASHVKNNNQPLGKETYIELGAFAENFTPTTANRSQWRANWTGIKRVAYDATTSFFSETVTLTNNNAPFTTTNRVWLWIFDRSGQWCLMGNSNWRWPLSIGPPGLPLDVSPGLSNEVLAGTVSTSPLVKCELVTDDAGPTVTYEEEAALLLPADVRGPHQDADGDGQSNWYEYAFGSNPVDRNSTSQVVAVRNDLGQSYLTAKINRGWTSGVNFQVQWSEDLRTWQSTGMTSVVSSLRLLEVRDSAPIGANAKRFIRVRITSP